MTDELTLNAMQVPQYQDGYSAQWDLDGTIVHLDRKNRVLTVEEFEGFTDDGEEITQAVTEKDEAIRILEDRKPYIIGLFAPGEPVLLLSWLRYCENSIGWTLAKEPR